MSLHRPNSYDLTRITASRRQLLRWGGIAATGAAAAPLLAACGDSGSSAPSSKNITWSSQAFYSSQSTNSEVVKHVKQQMDAFRSSSGYGVTLQVQSSDNNAAMSKLLQQASQGRAADVAEVDSYIFPLFKDYSQPIGQYLSAAGVQVSDFFPFFQPIMTGGGSQAIGLPINTGVRVLYYRKDLVAKPPTSWDEVISISKPLAAQGKYFMFPAGRDEDPMMCSLWPEFWAQGGEIVDANGKPAFATGAGHTAMLNALTFLQRCVDTGITPTRVSTFTVSDDMLPDIIAGRVAMFIGGSWMATNMQQQLKTDVTKDWAVAPIPTMSGSGFASAAGGWMWGFFAKDQGNLKAAVDFIDDVYIGTDAMAEFCTAAGYLPARQSVYSSPQFKGGPFTAEFKDSLAKYAKSRPGVTAYQTVSQQMQTAMSSVASKSATPEQALTTALTALS